MAKSVPACAGVAILIMLVQGAFGARHLSNTFSSSSGSVSAKVGGSPGSTGTIQMSFSGNQGSFAQSYNVNAPTAFQFSTDNGGTISIANPTGPPQVLTSVLTPGAQVAGVSPQVPIAFPQVQIPATGGPISLPALTLNPSDPDFNKKIRARIQALFDQLRARGAVVGPNGGLSLQSSTNVVKGGSAGNNKVARVANRAQNKAQKKQQKLFRQQYGGATVTGTGDNVVVSQTGQNSLQASSTATGPNASTSLDVQSQSVSGG